MPSALPPSLKLGGNMGRFISVEIDVDDLLDELDSSEVAEVLERRGVTDEARSVVTSAIAAIRQGRHDDAALALERHFLPRWQDKAACEAAYRQSMSAAAGDA